MASISYINSYFRAPSLLKPFQSRPRYQNLPGFLLIANSDHQDRDQPESSSHSRFPDFPPFFAKNLEKSGKSVFWIPGTKIKKIEIFGFLKNLIYDKYVLYKPLFPSPQPPKTLKIESAISKSTGVLTYS